MEQEKALAMARESMKNIVTDHIIAELMEVLCKIPMVGKEKFKERFRVQMQEILKENPTDKELVASFLKIAEFIGELIQIIVDETGEKKH